jgi:hypothetical protein
MAGIERYEKDIERLAKQGGRLALAMALEFKSKIAVNTDLPEAEFSKLPNVRTEYEAWYSEALALIGQLLPEREEDFKSYYRPKTPRKEIRHSNYTIADYLRATTIRRLGDVIVDPSAAVTPMYQQFNMIQGLQQRFKSLLFDIKTLVHADLLDDELHAAEELNTKGFQRGAGAIAGVVLEAHLVAVAERHGIAIRKKDPAIGDLNDALKSASVVETATWRFIQHLGDLRNKCDHKKHTDPTKDEVTELIEGVRKITKTVF